MRINLNKIIRCHSPVDGVRNCRQASRAMHSAVPPNRPCHYPTVYPGHVMPIDIVGVHVPIPTKTVLRIWIIIGRVQSIAIAFRRSITIIARRAGHLQIIIY